MPNSKSWRNRIKREKLFMKQGGFCYYCLCKVEMSVAGHHPRRGTLDHILAKDRGGTDDIDNLVLACFACNQRKGRRKESDFRKRERNGPHHQAG